jgi:hypothetical protein
MLFLATAIGDTPKMLRLMANFLEKEPEANFPTSQDKMFKGVPLTLNDEGTKSFKAQTSEFPHIYESGKAAMPEFNLVHAIGQLLTIIAIALDSISLDQGKDFETNLKGLHSIWGSMREMNAHFLTNRYKDKSFSYTKKDLISRLKDSAEQIEKNILPNIHNK